MVRAEAASGRISGEIDRLERAGRWSEADQLCARHFQDFLQRGEIGDALATLRTRARIADQQGEHGLAEDFASLSVAMAQAHNLTVEEGRALNALAATHYYRQQWTLASSLFEDALRRSFDSGDHELVAFTCQNLGVVANIRGDVREAKLRYLEALGAAVRAGVPRAQAMAYNNLGMACADQREWIEADLHFKRAAELAARAGDGSLLVKVRVNRAEPLLHLGDLRGAHYTLELAEEVSQAGTNKNRVDAMRFRGMLARAEGDPARSREILREAIDFTMREDLPLERAEVLRELAVTSLEVEELEQAREEATEALGIFSKLGAQRDERETRALLARIPGPADAMRGSLSGAGP